MKTPSSTVLLKGLLRYTIKQKIGSGGMATVYCADDHVLGREVALKMMHEHLISSPESVRRFSSEARAVATLSHENVVKIFDFGEIESRPYLVMEYVKGQSFQSFLEKYGTLPNLVALEICRQILEGLACAHSKGVFHRDIKPDNIIIDPDGVVKIMDFGIAYIVNQESVTMTGSFIGSPRYISPEQADGKPLAGTTDIFSLGVLLYVALAGRLPFNAEVAAAIVHSIIHDTPPSVFDRNPKVLFWLSDMVDRFLRKDPGARPDSAAALAGIDKDCREHGIQTGRERLRQFLADQDLYCANEGRELFEHYRARARKAVNSGQVAVALKSLEQAKAFGELTKDDERIINAHALRRRLMTVVMTGLILLAGGAGLFFLLHFISAQRGRLKTGHRVQIAALDTVVANSVPRPADSQRGANGLKTAIDSAKPVRVPLTIERSKKNTAQDKTPRASRETLEEHPAKIIVVQGCLKIQTNPPWAKVFIDNIERGLTPSKTMYPLPAGPHELKIVKEGFSEYRKAISVSGNDTIHLRVQLTP